MDESEDKGKVVTAVWHQGAVCAAGPKAGSSLRSLGALSTEDFTSEVPWRQCLFPGCNCPLSQSLTSDVCCWVTPTLQKALSCKISLKMIHHQLPSVGGPHLAQEICMHFARPIPTSASTSLSQASCHSTPYHYFGWEYLSPQSPGNTGQLL